MEMINELTKLPHEKVVLSQKSFDFQQYSAMIKNEKQFSGIKNEKTIRQHFRVTEEILKAFQLNSCKTVHLKEFFY